MESMSALRGDATTIPEATGEPPLVGLPPRLAILSWSSGLYSWELLFTCTHVGIGFQGQRVIKSFPPMAAQWNPGRWYGVWTKLACRTRP